MAWDAFAVCAVRRKVDPASPLAVLVGRSIANGITVAEMVEWLRREKHARHREG
jgi:phage tail sheath gpL-like